MPQALQWVTLGSIVAYLGYNTGGMFVTGGRTLTLTLTLTLTTLTLTLTLTPFHAT